MARPKQSEHGRANPTCCRSSGCRRYGPTTWGPPACRQAWLSRQQLQGPQKLPGRIALARRKYCYNVSLGASTDLWAFSVILGAQLMRVRRPLFPCAVWAFQGGGFDVPPEAVSRRVDYEPVFRPPCDSRRSSALCHYRWWKTQATAEQLEHRAARGLKSTGATTCGLARPGRSRGECLWEWRRSRRPFAVDLSIPTPTGSAWHR